MPMRPAPRGAILPALLAPGTDAMKHFKPKEAAQFLKQTPNALLVDCRSEMEYLFVGHPTGALHAAWNDGPDWEVNPHFVGQVKKLAGTNHAHRPVILICRSGNRSLDAGEALEKAGFTDVYNVLHGFEGDLDEKHQRNTTNGWRFDGLPWEQT
jgi:rhodanese-related sulfurtransferase